MKTSGRPITFLALVALLLIGGQAVRAWTGLEFDPESLRAWVDERGWLAPLIFVGLVTSRQFLLLPSALLLSVGGLLFGGPMGTLLGTIGLVGSAAVTFVLARGVGGANVHERVARHFPMLDRYIGSAGPLVVFLTVAYPAGLMTLVFWAAGFSAVRLLPLLLATGLGGLIRAASYSFFGATLLDIGSPSFWLATGALTAALLVPLLHPGLRRRLVRPADRPTA